MSWLVNLVSLGVRGAVEGAFVARDVARGVAQLKGQYYPVIAAAAGQCARTGAVLSKAAVKVAASTVMVGAAVSGAVATRGALLVFEGAQRVTDLAEGEMSRRANRV